MPHPAHIYYIAGMQRLRAKKRQMADDLRHHLYGSLGLVNVGEDLLDHSRRETAQFSLAAGHSPRLARPGLPIREHADIEPGGKHDHIQDKKRRIRRIGILLRRATSGFPTSFNLEAQKAGY